MTDNTVRLLDVRAATTQASLERALAMLDELNLDGLRCSRSMVLELAPGMKLMSPKIEAWASDALDMMREKADAIIKQVEFSVDHISHIQALQQKDDEP